MAQKTVAALETELEDVKRRLGLVALNPDVPQRASRSKWGAPMTEEELKLVPDSYIHLKSPDGHVIHKMPESYERNKADYKDYEPVRKDGSPIPKVGRPPKGD